MRADGLRHREPAQLWGPPNGAGKPGKFPTSPALSLTPSSLACGLQPLWQSMTPWVTAPLHCSREPHMVGCGLGHEPFSLSHTPSPDWSVTWAVPLFMSIPHCARSPIGDGQFLREGREVQVQGLHT